MLLIRDLYSSLFSRGVQSLGKESTPENTINKVYIYDTLWHMPCCWFELKDKHRNSGFDEALFKAWLLGTGNKSSLDWSLKLGKDSKNRLNFLPWLVGVFLCHRDGIPHHLCTGSLPSAFARLSESENVCWEKLCPFLLGFSRSGLCERLEEMLDRPFLMVIQVPWAGFERSGINWIWAVCSLPLHTPISSRGSWLAVWWSGAQNIPTVLFFSKLLVEEMVTNKEIFMLLVLETYSPRKICPIPVCSACFTQFSWQNLKQVAKIVASFLMAKNKVLFWGT